MPSASSTTPSRPSTPVLLAVLALVFVLGVGWILHGQRQTEAAHAALTDWQDADTAEKTANDRVRAAGRFKKRRATAEHHTAQTMTQDAERRLTAAWGGASRPDGTRTARPGSNESPDPRLPRTRA